MRVSNVTMYVDDVELASFALGLGETPDRYLIKAMSGIDADTIAPRFYSSGQRTGAGLFDFALGLRELVFRIALNPKFLLDETFSELRDALYRAISANRTGVIRIQFNDGASVVAQISGFIVKFETSLFTKSPEAQLTIRCNDPFFRSVNYVHITDASPSNPIEIPDSLSTAPHGFVMGMEFSATADSITMQDTFTDPEWTFTVAPVGGFEIGDVLWFSSETTDKYVYIDRASVIIPIVDAIMPNSVWPIIFPGANTFYLREVEPITSYDIKYYPAYWGV